MQVRFGDIIDKKIIKGSDAKLNTITVLENALKSEKMPIDQIITQTSNILINQFKSWRIFYCWVKAYSIKFNNINQWNLIFSEYQALNAIYPCDNLEKLDYELSNAISSLSLIYAESENIDFSLNDFEIAQLVEGKAKQSNNPKEYIRKELDECKTLDFFSKMCAKHKINYDWLKEMLNNQALNDLSLLSKKIYKIQDIYTTFIPTALQTTGLIAEEDDTKCDIKQEAFTNRAHAYAKLRTIGEYLIAQEPHAFTGYILLKLSTLEHMPLAQILEDFPDIQKYLLDLKK